MKFHSRSLNIPVAFALALVAGFVGGSKAFAAVPSGNQYQCAATATSCSGSNWAYLSQKQVTCCCSAGNNVWYQCISTINVYVDIYNNSSHCYREVGRSNTSQTCVPLPNTNPTPIDPGTPATPASGGSCCSLPG